MSQDVATKVAGADERNGGEHDPCAEGLLEGRRPLQKETLRGARGVQAGRAVAGT